MDIYGDDIDTILDAGDDPLNDNLNSAAADYADDDGAANMDDADGDRDAQPGLGQTIERKRRTVRNPQLRLNAERLIGDRGIHKLENSFVGIKFGGKGREAADLDMVMKRIEHWAHRLYPPFKFDDFIATAEKLGRKKQVQSHMNRYRQGLLEPRPARSDDEDGAGAGADAMDDRSHMVEPIDEFDDLIGQQIEKYRTAPPRTPAAHQDSTFNALRSNHTTMPGTPSFVGRAPVEASTPMGMNDDDDVRPLPATPARLSAEQMARIAENRRAAQEIRRKKQEAAAAAAELAEQTLQDEA